MKNSPSSTCSRCGVTIRPEDTEGLCPRCLMLVTMETGTRATAGVEVRGQEERTRGSTSDDTGGAGLSVADVGRLFPQLEIVKCLGRGGMGVVYKARQPRLDRWVALKLLDRRRGQDPEFAERFAREARALAQLAHPGIVAVHDSGVVEGCYYLLMEYVDGSNLRQVLAAGRLKPAEALAIVPQICEALQFAHDRGIVHRDIKPENILLDRGGRVKIADFGIAKLAEERVGGARLTSAGEVMGTPQYMAPEQLERPLEVDHRADIYSLGVVFYEMLTGELPLGKFPPPSRKVEVDVRLDEVVLRALEKEPALRYRQASELKTRVDTLSEATVERPQGEGTDPWAWLRVLTAAGFVILGIWMGVGLERGTMRLLLIGSVGAVLAGLGWAGRLPIPPWNRLRPAADPIQVAGLVAAGIGSVCLGVGFEARSASASVVGMVTVLVSCLAVTGALRALAGALGIRSKNKIEGGESRSPSSSPSSSSSDEGRGRRWGGVVQGVVLTGLAAILMAGLAWWAWPPASEEVNREVSRLEVRQRQSDLFQVRRVVEAGSPGAMPMSWSPRVAAGFPSIEETIYVAPEVLMDGSAVASFEVGSAEFVAGYRLQFILTKEGQEQMRKVTRENVGQKLAVLVDGQVRNVPRIMGEVMGDRFPAILLTEEGGDMEALVSRLSALRVPR